MLLGDGAGLIANVIENVLPASGFATLGQELLRVLEGHGDVPADLGDLLGVRSLELGDVLVVGDEALGDRLELDWEMKDVSWNGAALRRRRLLTRAVEQDVALLELGVVGVVRRARPWTRAQRSAGRRRSRPKSGGVRTLLVRDGSATFKHGDRLQYLGDCLLVADRVARAC